MGELLACWDLSFSYGGAPVFSHLSLALEEGEAVLLMGPSGCGKSSLAHCLAGLYPEYAGALSGEITALGRPLADYPPPRRAQVVSILFQNPDNQFCMGRVDREVLFTLENIRYTGDLVGRMRALLVMTGLQDLETAPIHTLSGGLKQKLALTTALAAGARLLILDEPFANLDPLSCRQLSALLRRLHGDGLSLFIVDHRSDWYLPFLSRVLVMDRAGQLMEIPAAEVGARREAFMERGLFCGGNPYPGRRTSAVVPGAPPMVEAEDLRLGYGKRTVLDRLTFTVPTGGVTALIGPSGSGKSTLLLALAGVIPFRGTLRLGGPAGLVFQNPRFQFLALTVAEEVLTTLRAAKPGAAEADLQGEAEALLSEFDLLPCRDASPYALSQGQQRRLALLAMLAGERPLLLLDEPTYAQDWRATQKILRLLERRLRAGLTVVMATHDLYLARHFADQVLLVGEGGLRPLPPEELARYAGERGAAPCAD